MPNENTFDSTTLRSPRYSGRRALNFLNRLPGDPTVPTAPAIEQFVAPQTGVSTEIPGLNASGADANEGDEFGNSEEGQFGPGGVAPAPDPGPSTADGNPAGNPAGNTDGNPGPPGDPAGDPGDAPGADEGGSPSGDPGGDAGGGAAGGDGGGACFITEAVMAAGGQSDAAPELEALRMFRDQTMLTNPVGQAMVAEYEAIAPIVVEAVSQRPDAMQIFAAIKGQFLDRAVQAIQKGDMNGAFQAYAEMMAFVTPFAVEAQIGPGGDPDDRVQPGQEGLDDFGDTAAFAAYSPEMASAATGGMEMDDPMGGDAGMMDQGGLPPQPAGMPGFPGGPTSGQPMALEPAIGQFVRRY